MRGRRRKQTLLSRCRSCVPAKQCLTDSRHQAHHQGIAHQERALGVRHTEMFGEPTRKAIELFEFFRKKPT